MLITAELPDCNDYKIFDCEGHLIPTVTSYDTGTREIELSICVMKSVEDRNLICPMMQPVDEDPTGEKTAPILVKFVLPGSYATKNDERI